MSLCFRYSQERKAATRQGHRYCAAEGCLKNSEVLGVGGGAMGTELLTEC